MRKILPEYNRSITYALIGMAFHFVVVVLPLIIHGLGTEGVEGVGWLTLLFDFPLTLLEVNFGILEHLVVTSTIGYILYYSLGGTVLYALGGWVVGFLRDAF
ncbi:hypothetical protein [Nitrospira sp. Ecomares 2.1]